MKKRAKGISLVELILSIAVLSFLSVYVIQMFITSKTLNQKAYDLDRSVAISETIFELVKSDKTLMALRSSSGFKHATFIDAEDGTTAIAYFDDKWKPVKSVDESVYSVMFSAEEIPSLNYERVDYKVVVEKNDREVEHIYEIDMQRYY